MVGHGARRAPRRLRGKILRINPNESDRPTPRRGRAAQLQAVTDALTASSAYRVGVTDTPWEPPLAGSELEHLIGALERLRTTFRWKVDDLYAAGLQTRIGASALTLGGLLKHLAMNEDFMFTRKLSGEPVAIRGTHCGTAAMTGNSAQPPMTHPNSSTRSGTRRCKGHGPG
jgi:hypothetical protein